MNVIFFAFLVFVPYVFGCDQIPVAQSTLTNCEQTSTGLSCDVELTAVSVLPLAAGSCAHFIVTGYDPSSGAPVRTTSPFDVKFNIDSYVHSCNVQATCLVADMTIQDNVECTCQYHVGKCTNGAEWQDLNCEGGCGSIISSNYPHAWVCTTDGTGSGCLTSQGDWCGCVWAEATNTEFFVSRVAGCDPWWQVTISSDYLANVSQVINSQVYFEYGNYDLGGVNFTWSVEQFAFPKFPTNVGNLVTTGPFAYLIDGVCACDEACNPDQPGWFRQSYDGGPFSYDNLAFANTLGWDYGVMTTNKGCINNANGVTNNQHNIAPLLTENNVLNTKLQGLFSLSYFYANWQGSYLALNPVTVSATQLTFSINAKYVEFVYDPSRIKIESCGSLSICEYSNRAGWLVADVYEAGTDILNVNCGNFTYQSSVIFFDQTGNFSYFMACPVGSNVTITSQTTGSTCSFQSACWNFTPAVSPITPTNNGSGNPGNLPSSFWTLIVILIAVILVALVMLCCCCLANNAVKSFR